MSEEFDAIVIGAGEAGTIVASQAVEAGKRVALVYKEPWGSTCLNVGCVPSKFMIHRARIAHLTRIAARYHVQTSAPRVNLAAIVQEKNALLAEHRAESYQGARAAKNLTLFAGEARFVSARDVVVADRRLRSERIFIATGLRPVIPAIDGLDRVPVLTNENVMELAELPPHLTSSAGATSPANWDRRSSAMAPGSRLSRAVTTSSGSRSRT